jgi:SAM-dependent methyltransferase
METERIASWHSPDYVAAWAGEDAIADLLGLPRRISASLVGTSGLEVRHVVDLGSGPGGYLELLLDAFPRARGTWVDSSEAMAELGREKLARFGDRVEFAVGDIEDLPGLGLRPAEVIVSSRAIHHFSHDSIRRLYRHAFELLSDGGWFFNLDHFGAPPGWKDRYRPVRDEITGGRKRKLDAHREPFELTEADVQVGWLREAGFDADLPWRAFFTALLAGRKSPAPQ